MCRNVLITLIIVSLLCSVRAKADELAYAYCPFGAGEGYVSLYDSPTSFGSATSLKCGEQVTILDAQDKDRFKVRTASGKEGYVIKYLVTADEPRTQPLPQTPQSTPRARSESRRLVRPRSALLRWAGLEFFAGYSYFRTNLVLSGLPLNINGASSSLTVYLSERLGITGDVSLYHEANVANGFSLTFSTYQVGPTLRFQNRSRFTPHVHVILGGGHAGGTLYTSSLGFGMPALGTNNAFLFSAGGGADWRLNPRITIRVLQADYLHSEFLNSSNSGNHQENLRLSAGIVLHFRNE